MSNFHARRILAVDDEESMLDFIARNLRHDYEVILATKGKEAISLAKRLKPEAILLDLKLPDMRGEEVRRILSKNESTSDIPVIYLSGSITKEEERIIGRFANGIAVLAKPITKEEILSAIDKVLGL